MHNSTFLNGWQEQATPCSAAAVWAAMLEMNEEICLKLGRDAHSEKKKQRPKECIVCLMWLGRLRLRCKAHIGVLSRAWGQLIPELCELHTVHRQQLASVCKLAQTNQLPPLLLPWQNSTQTAINRSHYCSLSLELLENDLLFGNHCISLSRASYRNMACMEAALWELDMDKAWQEAGRPLVLASWDLKVWRKQMCAWRNDTRKILAGVPPSCSFSGPPLLAGLKIATMMDKYPLALGFKHLQFYCLHRGILAWENLP